MTNESHRTAHSGEGREGAEHCRKCGRDNPSWSAPSPLWNAVMRGGSIDGNPIHDDLVCPSCFIGLAMEADIASGWRLIATEVNVPLETVTPSGRAWDDAAFLWDEQHSSHSGEGRSNGAGKALEDHFPSGLRSGYARTAGSVPVQGGGVEIDCRCGWSTKASDEHEARQQWADHARAALSARQGEVERLREALVAIRQRGIERDVKWAGMNAHDIARAALAQPEAGGER